jgi:hypothetical protein
MAARRPGGKGLASASARSGAQREEAVECGRDPDGPDPPRAGFSPADRTVAHAGQLLIPGNPFRIELQRVKAQ